MSLPQIYHKMPPKRGRGRGGSRGGSRGGRGRGGGSSGSFAPFKFSKSLKRRSRKRGNTELPVYQDTPELMDLGQTSYTREIRYEKPLMKSLSQRPNRSMMKEARYTDKHMEQTMSLTLRHRPVEFVKAEFNYDPSKDLIKKLNGAKESPQDAINEKNDPLNVKDIINGSKAQEGELSEKRCEEVDQPTPTKNLLPEDLLSTRGTEDYQEVPPVAEEILDEVQKLIIESSTHDSLEAGELIETVDPLNDIDNDADLELDVQTEEPEMHVKPADTYEEMNVDESPLEPSIREEVDSESEKESESSSIEFSIDLSGDTAALITYNVSKPDTASLLQQEHKARAGEQQRPKTGSNVEIEPYLTVGKVILKTSYDEDGTPLVNLPKGKINKSRKNGFVSLSQERNNQHDPFQLSKLSHIDTYEKSDSEFDAAFDDYMSQLMAANEDSDSDSDSASILANVVEDFDVDIDHSAADSDYGVHDDDDDEVYDRLRAEYQLDLGLDSDTSSIDFERYMEEMGMDDELDDIDDIVLDLNSDEEGLEEILAFAKQHKRLADLDLDLKKNIPPPRVGKGIKQRLELGSDLEIELRASLMEQFQYQKQSRRLKKIRKKEKKLQDAMGDLFLKDKYEYSLHIKEIKQEFELFLHDAARESLSFPPLDGHGNKTLSKLATNYNMKCIKCGGNGTALYMKIAKTKKTFRYVPDYQLIGYIMKQRPVFRRADVKPRSKDEIVETGDDKIRRGPKSNAYVREGDVVGGLAPEIDQNNIGRKMLEMLGWLRGEGLGALGNKGISTPVLATVKKSKTGLK